MEAQNEVITEETTQAVTLEQAEIQPTVDINALQKSYSELQSAFTKKAQAYKELEQKINSMLLCTRDFKSMISFNYNDTLR